MANNVRRNGIFKILNMSEFAPNINILPASIRQPVTESDKANIANIFSRLADNTSQIGQLADATAKLNTKDVDNRLQGLALKTVQGVQNYHYDLLNSNKGFGKYKLNPEQTLQFGQRYRQAENDLEEMKNFRDDYKETTKAVGRMLGRGEISQEDFTKYQSEIQAGINDANETGDITKLKWANLVANQYIHPKPTNEDLMKKYNEKSLFEKRFWDDVLESQQGQPSFDEQSVRSIIAAKPADEKQIIGGSDDDLVKLARARWARQKTSPLGWANYYLRVDEANKKAEEAANGNGIIEPYAGYSMTAPVKKAGSGEVIREGQLMKDGTNRYPISAFNIKYTGEASEIDQSTEKPTGNKVVLKDATRSELVQDYKGGKKYVIVTNKEKDADGNPIDVKYVVRDANDTRAKLPKTVQLKGWDENFGKGATKHPLPSGKPRTVTQNGYTYTWNEQTGKYE